MNIAIVGYGKMGRLIEQLAPEYDAQVALKLDEYNNADYSGLTADNFDNIDVAIEFSTPHAVVGNLERLIALRVNTVVGTTGWNDHLPHIREVVARHKA